ncbi:putative zinc transporter [Vitis vinifera]|uniref:Putative zinc transporter n=1 Tax=Vitis vinifera TaxID=29760 RepID=A0A438D4L5_VITVI|nr:putative zinc transporter [Vitis vinifera]
MQLGFQQFLLFSLFFLLLSGCVKAESETESLPKLRTAPHRNVGDNIIDGSGTETAFRSEDGKSVLVPFFFVELDPQWAGICNGMAAGVMLAASFDLVQEGQEHGTGNWVMVGILAGGIFIWLCKKFLEQYGEVSMLDIKGAEAAKVVLVIGIMTLHSFGEGAGVGVSFAGSKGFSQGILVTLAIAVHNIPEGLAVSMVLASRGVSPQNAMLWSVITSLPQPIVAVPSFICADAFNKFLPFCTGFAAGCMIWMVVAEVLPDAFKCQWRDPSEFMLQTPSKRGQFNWLQFMVKLESEEASPSQVASAATLSVAFMEALGTLFQNFSHDYKYVILDLCVVYGSVWDSHKRMLSLNSPGPNSLVTDWFFFALLERVTCSRTLLSGHAQCLEARLNELSFHNELKEAQRMLLDFCFPTFWSRAIAWWHCSCVICSCIPLPTCSSHKCSLWHCLCTWCLATIAASAVFKNGVYTTDVSALDGICIFPHFYLQYFEAFLSCGAVAFHALAEGLALGVAAPKAYGLGRHMVLPVSLHGLPRGAAVASCIFGATDSWHGSLAAAALIGFVGPVSAIGAILAGIDYSGLDHLMVFACGGLLPGFWKIVRRSLRLDMRKSICGLMIGVGLAALCLTCTKLVCLHTPYCNSAPEAVR